MRLIWLPIVGSIAGAGSAHAICRLVTETGSAPPAIYPAQSVLLILRHHVPVGCEPADAGPPADAGAGPACTPSGYIEDVTSMVVQPHFRSAAGGSRFALLMVTPRTPRVSLFAPLVFPDLERRTAPVAKVTTVTVEDPALGYQCQDPKWNTAPAGGGGCGAGYDSTYDPPPPPVVSDAAAGDARPVDAGLPPGPIVVGDYEVGVLDVPDTDALRRWLDANRYQYDALDLQAVAPYVQRGYSVIAVRVAAAAGFDGALPALAFTYEGADLTVPAGIGAMPGIGVGEPIAVYVAADGRYDVDGGNVRYALPAGVVAGAGFLTRTDLYVELGGTVVDPVPQRRAGDTSVVETYPVTREVHIPAKCPPQPPRATRDRDDEPISCGCRAGGRDRSLGGWILVAALAALALRRALR